MMMQGGPQPGFAGPDQMAPRPNEGTPTQQHQQQHHQQQQGAGD